MYTFNDIYNITFYILCPESKIYICVHKLCKMNNRRHKQTLKMRKICDDKDNK